MQNVAKLIHINMLGNSMQFYFVLGFDTDFG